MTIARFTPREMTEGVRNVGDALSNFLTQKFFSRRNLHATATIDYGELNGDAKLALYSHVDAPAVPVDHMAGASKTVVAPRIRLKKIFDRNKAETLNPGINPYAGPYTDPNEQLLQKILEEQMDLRRKIDRSIEVQAAQALGTGSVTITYPDASTATITFGYTGTATGGSQTMTDTDSYNIQQTRTGTNAWSSEKARPNDDLKHMVNQIRNNSDYDGPLCVVMGPGAFSMYVNCPTVKDFYDNRNMRMGSLSPLDFQRYVGNAGALDLFEYVSGYENSAGARVASWASNLVAVVPMDTSGFSTEFGAVFDYAEPGAMNQQFIKTDYFSKFVRREDPAVTELIVESNPLVLVKKPKAIRVMTVA